MAISSLTGAVSANQMATFTTGFRSAGVSAVARIDESASTAQRATRNIANRQEISRTALLEVAIKDFGEISSVLAGTSRVSPKASVNAAFSTNPEAVTASADFSANGGGTDLNVFALAKSQILETQPQTGATRPIGSGAEATLTFEFGEVKTTGGLFDAAKAVAGTVTIDSTNNTLSGIANAINQAAIGISADVVSKGGGQALQLVSEKSGAQNGFRLSVSGDTALSNLLSFDPENDSAGNQRPTLVQSASNASVAVDGVLKQSASNTLTNEVNGVTFSLLDLGKTRVEVTPLEPAAQNLTATPILAFTNSFNNLASLLGALKSTDRDGNEAISAIESRLSGLFSPIEALKDDQFRSFKEVGLTKGKDGLITPDVDALKKALDTDPERVRLLFTGNNQGTADRAVRFATGLGEDGNPLFKLRERLEASLEGNHDANNAATHFENTSQTKLAVEYAGLNATNRTGLLDSRTLQGLPGPGSVDDLFTNRSPALDRLRVSQANIAYQSDIGSNLRFFPGLGFGG